MKLSTLDKQNYDVIVCGAGSAGVAAAYSAAKAGAKTLLLERHGYSGGILTAAMIHTFDAIKSCADNGQTVVAGFAKELLNEISALGGDATEDNPGEALTVHFEMQKIAADRLLNRAGVTTLYHAPVVEIIMEGTHAVGVEAALRDGRARFYANTIVDGTGDAQMAFFADAPWSLDKDLQALTYHFRLGNITKGFTWNEWEDITRKAMDAAHAAGEIKVYGGPWIIRLNEHEISLNTTRVYGNPNDPVEVTNAEITARAQMLQIWNILRERSPELKDSYILSGASQLHIRESRIIEGDYVLTETDIKDRTQFPDTIALGAWPIDIHPTNGKVGVHPHKESPPEPYQIPFRCLLPKGVDNLLVAGKPISTTHRAHGSTRVPGTSLATGQAAGVAAALSAKQKSTPRQVPIEQIREVLVQQGAILNN